MPRTQFSPQSTKGAEARSMADLFLRGESPSPLLGHTPDAIRLVMNEGKQEDLLRLYDGLVERHRLLGSPVIADSLWDEQDPTKLQSFLTWLEGTDKLGFPDKSSALEHFVNPDLLGSEVRPRRTDQMVASWLQSATRMLRQPGSSSVIETREKALNYYVAMLDTVTNPHDVEAALKLSANPSGLACRCDSKLETHIEHEKTQFPDWSEAVVRTRFADEGEISTITATNWLGLAIAKGMDISVLQAIHQKAPAAAKLLLCAEPKRTARDLAAATDYNPEGKAPKDVRLLSTEESADRITWLLNSANAREGDKELFPFVEEAYCELPSEALAVIDKRLAMTDSFWAEHAPAAMMRNPLGPLWAREQGKLSSADMAIALVEVFDSKSSRLDELEEFPHIGWDKDDREMFAAKAQNGPCDIRFLRFFERQDVEIDYIDKLTKMRPESKDFKDDGLPFVAQRAALQERDPDDGRLGAVLARMVDGPRYHQVSQQKREAHSLRWRMLLMRSAGLSLTPADALQLPWEKAGEIASSQAIVAAEAAMFPGADIAKARSSPAVDRVLRIDESWNKRLGVPPPMGLAGLSCYGFKPTVFESVKRVLNGSDSVSIQDDSTTVARNNYAYNLTCLFGTEDRVARFAAKHKGVEAAPSSSPLSDKALAMAYNSAAQFEVPQQPGWAISSWGDACLKHGIKMAKFVKHAKEGDVVPVSIAGAVEKYATLMYPGADQHPETAKVCTRLGLDEETFHAVVEASKAVDAAKSGVNVPLVEVDGARFGLPGYVWHAAKTGDPRVLLAGVLVNCCQHIAGAAAEAALHSATSPNGRCYFLEKEGDDPMQAEVAAVSWAWAGSSAGELCFDSYEAIGPRYRECLPSLLVAMREELAANHPQFNTVTMGKGGGTPALPLPTSPTPLRPVNFSGYHDSHDQYLLRSGDKATDLLIAVSLQRTAAEPSLSQG
jgi:hypothetical protein